MRMRCGVVLVVIPPALLVFFANQVRSAGRAAEFLLHMYVRGLMVSRPTTQLQVMKFHPRDHVWANARPGPGLPHSVCLASTVTSPRPRDGGLAASGRLFR